MSKPNLQSLVRWAKRHEYYLEVYRDGSAMAEDKYETANYYGNTPYEALLAAKKDYKELNKT
jgi:hypothetical protein